MWKRLSLFVLAVTLSVSFAPKESAAEFPEKTIRIIVGFRAGGSSDAAARIIGKALRKVLGVAVVVENRPGGGGRRANAKVYKSKPNGYTILLADMPAMQIGEIGFKGKYKTLKFTMLQRFFARSHAVAVRQDSPIMSYKQLVRESKKKRMTFSSSGIGTTSHLQYELMSRASGLKLTQVPYDSGRAATAAVIGGKVDLTISGIQGAVASTRAGKLRILTVLLDDRLPLISDVPTLKELGYPKGYFNASNGIVGPPGMSKERQGILVKALEKVAKDSAIAKWAARVGRAVAPLGPAAYLANASELYETVSKHIKILKKRKKKKRKKKK